MLLFQIRPVQTFIAKRVLTVLSERTDHTISIERVKISWLDRASINEFMVLDQAGDTLIYTEEATVNYKLWELINGNYLNIESIVSDEILLHLIKHDSTSQLNLTTFVRSLKGDTAKQRKNKPILIDNILLTNFKFQIDDFTKIPKKNRMDFTHLDFRINDLSLGKFEIKTDTIAGNVLQLSGQDVNSGFEIKKLYTLFRLTNKSLSIDDLDFNTPSSHIADSLEFFYNGLDDLGHFVDSVSFVMHLNNSVISQADLQLVTGVDKVKSDIQLDGIFWGTVGDFNIEDSRIALGRTFFRGGVSCFGLPDISKTFILADVVESHLVPSDLVPYVGDISENLRRMGRIDFTGSFAGFVKDFVARGDFFTDQGSVHTDINIKIPSDPSMMSYKGNLKLKQVNVGAFLKNDIVQKINLNATIEGRGIQQNNADFNLKAMMFNSGLKGYEYDSVFVDGHFAKNFFNGKVSVDDPNCKFDGTAQVDFRTEHENLELNIILERIFTDRLLLTEDEIYAQGHLDLSVVDLDIDSFKSNLKIDSSLLRLNGRSVILDSIRFNASLIDSVRLFSYSMPGLKGELKGRFNVRDVLKDIPNVSSGYLSKFSLLKDSITNEGSGNQYKLDLKLEIGDVNPYLDSLNLPINFKSRALVEGSFRQSQYSYLSLFIQTDSIQVARNKLHNPTLEINGSKDDANRDVLTNFIFSADKLLIPGVPPTENLLMEGIWYDDIIDFTTRIKQPETASKITLESNLMIKQDSILLKMQPSDIQILNDSWKFNPSNEVLFLRDRTLISNLEIYDQSESLRVEGIIADSIPTSIRIIAEDLNMNKTDLFTNSTIDGFLNGNFHVFRDSKDDSYKFDGGFLLKNLKYDDLLIGDVSGSSNWNPLNQRIYTNLEVAREGFRSIHVEGYYYPSNIDDQLNFDVTFDQASLELAKPLVKQNFSQIAGNANGVLKVTGNPSTPQVVGNASILDGRVTVDYLNTRYTFDGDISFDPRKIELINFELVDRKGAQAVVSGDITHSSFKNFITNLTVNSSNFEFLNTTSLDNKLYYGSAYGSGEINVTGPLNDLLIEANITTDSDTRFFIPVSESTSSAQQEYIEFVDFNDTTRQVVEEQTGIKGLTLDFDIIVTPDAYCELIFDIKTGDIIRGRGRGNLKLRLNTDGEFNMFGPLEITEGAYNFTVPNFINKEFEVTPGSRITWYGDPYDAILSLEATYLQRASFEELNNPENQDQALLSDRVPINVVLNLNGGMLTPDIDFDIRLQNEGDADNRNVPLLAQIRNDEQELRRQVISLLFLKKFSPRQSFALGGGGGSIGSSVSEFLSSQVSYLVSQIDENLEVEVNLADLNQDAFNTFQLRFAYTFLGGRLKVTRGGSFGNEESEEQNVLNDIVGDWSVEYSLTKDGRLRAKVFRNSNQRLITNDGQQSQETGVSLRFVHSFNDLKDLLTLRREEGIRRKEDEESDNSASETNQNMR